MKDFSKKNQNLLDENKALKQRIQNFEQSDVLRKQTEKSLLEQQESLKTAQRIAHIGNYKCDLKTGEVFWSDELLRIYGLDPAETGNIRSLEDSFSNVHPEDAEQLKLSIDEAAEQEKGISSEYRILRPNGECRHLISFTEPIFDHEGNLSHITGTAQDITERKQAEKQMHFLGAITENMHDSVVVTNLQGHITYLNKRAEILFGYTQEELAGKSPDFLNINPKAEEIQAELYETVAKGEVYQGVALNQRKNGSEFICEFSVSPLTDENGVVSSYIGLHRDITEIRNLQNAAIRQERLSAIGELASGVAHDFNNALQIILGGVDMALASEEPEELNQYLKSIKHSAGDAASRVRQLQRFSQKSQTQKESVLININNLAEDVIKETKLLLNQYQGKGIHLEVKSDYKAGSHIEGNEGALRACLFNLIKNSAEAMPEGGKITISTDEHDDRVYVRVTDTGFGMDEETQKKIFQPFFSTKGFKPGRGLGMAQVYSTIRDHNGDVYIKESVVGNGTIIEFALPVSKKELILEKKDEDYAGTAHILCVDDEKMIRKIYGEMLEMLGHTADLAANGNEALAFLAQGHKYDLVITDIGMPGMSGWQLAEQIKNRGYTTRIAVVTGWGAEVSQEEKNRYNVGYVLGKPIDLKDLKALINEVIQMKDISGKDSDY